MPLVSSVENIAPILGTGILQPVELEIQQHRISLVFNGKTIKKYTNPKERSKQTNKSMFCFKVVAQHLKYHKPQTITPDFKAPLTLLYLRETCIYRLLWEYLTI